MIGTLRTRGDERVYWIAIGTVVALSWAIVALLPTPAKHGHAEHGTPSAYVHATAHRVLLGRVSDPHAEEPGRTTSVALAFGVFVASWAAMAVAMMLPTALPLMTLFRATVGRRPRHHRLLLWLIGGYLSLWVLFGIALYFGDAAIHVAVGAVPTRIGALLPLVLLVAVLYQFTPLKDRCLQECRSPFAFLATRWRGLHPVREALRLGVEHGLFCLGCCWPLMLVMFAVGVAHLPVMLVLGAVMAAEKSMPWGRRLVAPVGVGLLLLAATLAAQEWFGHAQ